MELILKEIDPEFLKKIKWDIGKNILSGYESKFQKIKNTKLMILD